MPAPSVGFAGISNGESVSAGETGMRLPLKQQLQACAFANGNPVPLQLLRKYIAYAQTYTTPVLSVEAKEVRFPSPGSLLLHFTVHHASCPRH